MQHKRHSFYEAITSTAVGFVLALVIQHYLYQWYNIPVTHSQNMQIVLVMTVVSVLRGYVLRRVFNKHTVSALAKPHSSGKKEMKRRFDPSQTYLCPIHGSIGGIIDMGATEFLCDEGQAPHIYTIDEAILKD